MLIVPHLAEHRVAIIRRILPRLGGVEAGTSAAQERRSLRLLDERGQDLSVRVRGGVGGRDIRGGEPFERREALLVPDDGLEEVDDFLVLAVLRAVAGHVEGAEAVAVLGHLVAPEARVVLVLRNPVCVHVFEEVGAAKGLEEGADVGARVGEHGGTVREAIGGVGAWNGVILPAQVTVLGVAAIAEVGPET